MPIPPEYLTEHTADTLNYLRELGAINDLPDVYNLSVNFDEQADKCRIRVLLNPVGLDELGRINGIRGWAEALCGEVHLGDPYESAGRIIRPLTAVRVYGLTHTEVFSTVTVSPALETAAA